MIPESVGATPLGIFQLADEFLEAARAAQVQSYSATQGPTRLLAYHACELYLKTFLRSHGNSVEQLRKFQHDLSAMTKAACALGLVPTTETLRTVGAVVADNEYVRARYLVSPAPGTPTAKIALRLAADIRECVRSALNYDEFGNPLGALWACGAEPPDLVEAKLKWAEKRRQRG